MENETMIVIFTLLVASAAFALLNGKGHPVMAWIAVGLGVVVWWSASIMRSQASHANTSRRQIKSTILRSIGASEQEIERETKQLRHAELGAVSDKVTLINMLAVIGLLLMLILGIFLRAWF